MTPSPGVTSLLNQARASALEKCSGQPATLQSLAELSGTIRMIVLRQVYAGLWTEHGVADPAGLAGLRVAVTFGNVLVGEPPLRVDYDFSRTAMPLLVVRSVPVSSGRP